MDTDDAAADDESTLEDLIPIVRRGLDDGDPLALLGLASATLAIVLHPADAPPGAGEATDRLVEHVVLRYVEHGSEEALAYAAAMTALLPTGPLRSSLQGALDGVDDQLPRWLAEIDRATIESTTIVRDLFDDDEWLLAGIHLVEEGHLSFRVTIDHGADGALVDGALMRQSVDQVRQQLRSTASEDEVSITEVPPGELVDRYADARAVADDPRTDTWPSSRPLVEWALRLAQPDLSGPEVGGPDPGPAGSGPL